MGKIIHTTNLSALGTQALSDSDIMLVQQQTGTAGKVTLTDLKAYIGGGTPTVTHTVTFKVGSTVYNTQTVAHGGNASTPATPDWQNCPSEMQNKTFVSWSGSYTNVQADVTVTAVTDDNEITVNVTDTVHTYDGAAHQYTVIPSLNHGGTPTIYYSLDDETYSTSWPGTYIEVNSYPVYYKVTATNYPDKKGQATLVITATASHTVTFKVGSIVYNTQTVAHGGDAVLPDDPTYVNCPEGMQYKTFNSWTGDWQNVTEDRTLTADCTDNSISYAVTGTEVTYDGNPHMFDVTVACNPESTYSLQWSETGASGPWGSKPSYTAVGSYDVYFQITATNYETITSYDTLDISAAPPTTWTVTFKDDRTWSTSFQIEDGEKMSASDIPTAPSRESENYDFAAWQLNGSDVDPTTVAITAATTFVARYEYDDPYTYLTCYFDSPYVASWDTTNDKATIVDTAYDTSKVKFQFSTTRSSVTAGVKWTVSVSAGQTLGTITDDTAMTKTTYVMRNAFSDSKTVTAAKLTLTYYSNY